MENELELETSFETESDLHNAPVSMKLKFTLWLKITSTLDTQSIFILAVLCVLMIYCALKVLRLKYIE